MVERDGRAVWARSQLAAPLGSQWTTSNQCAERTRTRLARPMVWGYLWSATRRLFGWCAVRAGDSVFLLSGARAEEIGRGCLFVAGRVCLCRKQTWPKPAADRVAVLRVGATSTTNRRTKGANLADLGQAIKGRWTCED